MSTEPEDWIDKIASAANFDDFAPYEIPHCIFDVGAIPRSAYDLALEKVPRTGERQ